MSQVPELVSTRLEHASYMFTVLANQYRDIPTGQEYNRTVVDIGHRAAVVILPILSQPHVSPEPAVVFTRQYRHAINRVCLELPAGVIDEGEGPWDAAQRELEEETGYRARALQYMCSVDVSPGWNNERQHFFLAWDLEERRSLNQDEFENVEVQLINKPDVYRLIKAGHITDLKSIACFGLYSLNLEEFKRGG